MNELQARLIREAHDGYVHLLARKPKAELARLYGEELAAHGRTLLFGGPASKDELIGALVEMRYPLVKMNESIHVLYHTPEIVNEICEWCNPNPCPVCGALATCDYEAGRGPIVNGRHVTVGWDLAAAALLNGSADV